MKLRIDQEADALYLRLHDSKIVESEQVAPGVIVDFDGKNKVVGVEVLNISMREAKPASAVARRNAAAVVREKPGRKYSR